ncbi:MAG: VWA domain-containing protein [Chlamydiota bacterium]
MMHIESPSSQQKKILITCMIATIGIHVTAFFYFYKFPPSLPVAWHKLLAQSLPILKMIPKEDESKLLEEFFEPFPDLSTLLVHPFDMLASTTDSERHPKEEPSMPLSSPEILELKALEEKSFPLSPLVSTFSFTETKENLDLVLPESYSLPMPSINYEISERLATAPLMIDIEIDEMFSITQLPASPQKIELPARKDPISIPQIKIDTALDSKPNKVEISHTPSSSLPLIEEKMLSYSNKKNLSSSLSSVENYKIPEPKTIEIAEDLFSSDVRIAKAPSGKGYIFAISLTPAKNAAIKSMQQNYTFLIDRTNSIPKHHFTSFKKATMRALSMLQEEDTFNIVVFDRKVTYFSKTPVYYSKDALQDAETFLNKEKNGGLFTAADLYELLPKILPANTSEDKVNTVILLTDGTTDAKKAKQDTSMRRILESTKKKFTLYTAAVSKGNNLKLLDSLSSCTGGSLLYSDTYAAFPRKLAGLVYRLRAPLAKDLTVTVSSQDSSSKIELYTPSYSVFHSGQPFEIVGHIENLHDFTLLIEGTHEEKAIRIKKKINVSDAKKDSAFVMKKWQTQKSRTKLENLLTPQPK